MAMEEQLKKQTKEDSKKIEILDFIRLILICFVVVFLCVKFVFRPVTVDGDSMVPTLHNNEFGFSNVFSTFVSDVKRFEVVVLNNENTHKLWVKRVIGLPNEKVEYRDDKLYINDQEIKETFLDPAYVKSVTGGTKLFTENFGPYYLADDEYFVVGDNRGVSRDSRKSDVGPFPRSAIVSKYVIVLYPFDQMRIVSNGS